MIKKTTVSFYKRAFPAGAVLVPTIAQIQSDSPEVVTFEMQIEAKEKRYVLPMEGTNLDDGTIAYATIDHTGVWTIKGYSEKKSAVTFHDTVTQADIDAAPAWVKAIKPVEVTDDDQ